jgi:1-acyl-sn-glycerol-3-phosphate acyltransferase
MKEEQHFFFEKKKQKTFASLHPLQLRKPVLLKAFRWYLHAFVWLRFSAVRVSKAGLPAPHDGRPLVIYSNHPSWWDPAVYVLIGHKLFPQRQGFGPMDAAELGRWGFFRHLGIFGLQPGVRGAARFLRVAKSGLTHPNAALWITAEGAFTDARQRPLHLQPGIAHLARDVPGIILLPLALEYVFWNESRPEILLRFGEAMAGGPGRVADWKSRLTDALTATLDNLAEESASRDPSRFTTLLPGITQTGLFFQKLRRETAAT